MRYAARILCSLFLFVTGLSGAAAADTPQAPLVRQAPPPISQTPQMSLPLWLPSAEQKQEAEKLSRDYFAALDKADFAAAYDMMDEVVRSRLHQENYVDKKTEMQNILGALQERTILKTEWVGPSKNAPFPGVYAGVEMTARYANASRYCGYIVLYQAPAEKIFQVMREEINFIEDRMAQEISKEKSPEDLEKTWTEMSGQCKLKQRGEP